MHQAQHTTLARRMRATLAGCCRPVRHTALLLTRSCPSCGASRGKPCNPMLCLPDPQ